jgi:hypothetical protein
MRIKLISSRCLCELWMLAWLLCLLHFYVFIHMHCCTSFRYASWNTWRTWCRAKPEDGVWWIHPEDGRIRKVLEWEMLAKQVSSDKHWLESDPKQAPKHYKPPTFKAINYIYVVTIVALVVGVGWKPLLHYIILCLDIWILESYIDQDRVNA